MLGAAGLATLGYNLAMKEKERLSAATNMEFDLEQLESNVKSLEALVDSYLREMRKSEVRMIPLSRLN